MELRLAVMFKSLFLAVIIGLGCFFCPTPKANAMDPVTIALLAPVALKAGQTAYPYVIKGMANAGRGCVAAGIDMLNIFRLPLGFFQVTALAPFGGLSPGLRNIGKGCIAPIKLAVHTAMIPFNMFGVPVIWTR